MNTKCYPNNKLIDKTINVILHTTILFVILSIVFVYHGSNIIKSTTNNSLDKLIKDNLSITLNSLSKSDQADLKQKLKTVDFKTLLTFYNIEDKTTKTYNDWLFKCTFIICVFLIIIVVLLVITADSLCSPVNIKHLLVENIVVLFGVQFIEIIFFIFIVSKYSFISNSSIYNIMLTALKDKFTNK
jgi:hypothetical protein